VMLKIRGISNAENLLTGVNRFGRTLTGMRPRDIGKRHHVSPRVRLTHSLADSFHLHSRRILRANVEAILAIPTEGGYSMPEFGRCESPGRFCTPRAVKTRQIPGDSLRHRFELALQRIGAPGQ
jgi:hypothetical protein